MTWAAGRFLLDSRAAEDGVDASRDLDWAGVRSSMMFADIGSCFTAELPGSRISIRSSSSSSSLAGVLPPRFTASASLGADHVPSGSTTTESTSVNVDLRISSTYLYSKNRSQRPITGYTRPWNVQTYWSTCNDSKLVDLEHTGQVHVGACFCSSKKDDASKHWLCVQTTERQGT